MSRTEAENWLRLHIAARDTVAVRQLINIFGSPGKLLEKDPDVLYPYPEDEKIRNKLIFARSDEMNERMNKVIAVCKKNSWRIITPESEYYPKELKELKKFPFALFASGNLKLLNSPMKISCVGTRNATQNARAASYIFAYGLAKNDVTVVSGGALGIDSAVHMGAVNAGGNTIAVLGAGLGSDYLSQNEELRRTISEKGLLLSELLPNEAPSKYTFPERNRIIAALGKACFVAQSGETGGSMITAKRACELRRQILVPNPEILQSEGCTALLKKDAKEVKCAADAIMEMFSGYVDVLTPDAYISLKPDFDSSVKIFGLADFIYGKGTITQQKPTAPKKAKKPKEKKEQASVQQSAEPISVDIPKEKPQKEYDLESLSEPERKVFAVLSETPISLDSISDLTEMSTDDIASALIMLEIKEMVRSYYGDLYATV